MQYLAVEKTREATRAPDGKRHHHKEIDRGYSGKGLLVLLLIRIRGLRIFFTSRLTSLEAGDRG